MRGLDLLGATDDTASTAAAAAAALKAQQSKASPSSGSMSWPMIGGAVLAVVAMVLAVPWILKNA